MSGEREGRPIPKSNIPHHWWYDPRETGVFNSSPPAHTIYANSPSDGIWGSPSSSKHFNISPSPDPKVAIPLPAAENWNQWRRDSLKNFFPLDDFATPD